MFKVNERHFHRYLENLTKYPKNYFFSNVLDLYHSFVILEKLWHTIYTHRSAFFNNLSFAKKARYVQNLLLTPPALLWLRITFFRQVELKTP